MREFVSHINDLWPNFLKSFSASCRNTSVASLISQKQRACDSVSFDCVRSGVSTESAEPRQNIGNTGHGVQQIVSSNMEKISKQSQAIEGSLNCILIAYGKQKFALELLDAIVKDGRLLPVQKYRIVLEGRTILGHALGHTIALAEQFARLQQLQTLVEILRLMETLLASPAHAILTILLDFFQTLLALLLRSRVESQDIDNFTVCTRHKCVLVCGCGCIYVCVYDKEECVIICVYLFFFSYEIDIKLN